MKRRLTLAIIGSGPSCIYLLKHVLDRVETLRNGLAAIEIFEKRRMAGMGMPYHPETTERTNMANISSEEIPELTQSFADWLRGLDAVRLHEFGIEPGKISEQEIYSRLALGEYLHAQFLALLAGLANAGIAVQERTKCKIVDVVEEGDEVTLIEEGGARFSYDRVVLATGHYWPEDDHPETGYYVSPWPMAKLLPAEDGLYNFPIGTLGASLSAFDVVSSLAHRHGTFEEKDGRLKYERKRGAEGFRITMHAGDGLLPHLQYVQREPLREIERHVGEHDLREMRDEIGFLRLSTYFDRVCRPVLIEAFRADAIADVAGLLEDAAFGFEQLAETMTERHRYRDAFAGMRKELVEAEERAARNQPMHWKEALDDLMYTLNFYAEWMPAEDHLTLHTKVLPFVMNVIAALPLCSAKMLLALHDAGCLDLVPGKVKVADPAPGATKTTVKSAEEGNEAEYCYALFVDCGGQAPLKPEEFPFPSLVASGTVREARAALASPEAVEKMPDEMKKKVVTEESELSFPIGGIEIDREYRVVGTRREHAGAVFDVAFPHAMGKRPYSYGLQACNDTARLLVAGWRSFA